MPTAVTNTEQSDRRLFSWIADLAPPERSVFTACVGGWALDGMDVQIYSFVIPALIATWNITRAEAGALGTAALLFSSRCAPAESPAILNENDSRGSVSRPGQTAPS